MIRTTLKVIRGGDVPAKMLKVLQQVTKDNKKMSALMWTVVGEHLIKHCMKDEERGMIISTFRNLGFDLSKFASDTSRIPMKDRPTDKNAEGKGRRIRIFAENNRLTLHVTVDNPQRLWADLLNDPRVKKGSPVSAAIMQLFAKEGLKPV